MPREGPGPRLGHGRRHGVARDWIGGDAQTQMDDGGVLLEKLGSDVERLTNDKTLEETEDMAALENLSEATMLECLRRRYRRDRIYSSLGGVVVAIPLPAPRSTTTCWKKRGVSHSTKASGTSTSFIN